MRKPSSIPHTTGLAKPVRDVVDPIKENIEVITGQRGQKIARLGPSSTLTDLVNWANDLADLLQGPQ